LSKSTISKSEVGLNIIPQGGLLESLDTRENLPSVDALPSEEDREATMAINNPNHPHFKVVIAGQENRVTPARKIIVPPGVDTAPQVGTERELVHERADSRRVEAPMQAQEVVDISARIATFSGHVVALNDAEMAKLTKLLTAAVKRKLKEEMALVGKPKNVQPDVVPEPGGSAGEAVPTASGSTESGEPEGTK
jgi:hypothetical protein